MRSGGRSSGRAAAAGRRSARRAPLAPVLVLALAVSTAFFVCGCAASEPDGGSTPSSSTAPDAETTTTTSRSSTTTGVTIGELGERRNPIPMGQEAQVGDWKVRVVSAALDATGAVLDANMFNKPPEPGSQYVLVGIEATYVGEESSTFWVDMSYTFLGGQGESFGAGVAVAPDSILDEGEVFADGAVAGNLVFVVTSDQVACGTVTLEEAFSLEKTRVFFAVE